jgi:hypothetical protein
MPYSRFYPAGWRNRPDTSTPIDAAALDHIEDGLADLSDQIDEGLPDPHIHDVAGDTGVTDDAVFVVPAVRPDTGDEFGTILRATLSDGLVTKITPPTGSLKPDALTFAQSLDPGRGFPLAITVGNTDEIAAGLDRNGLWRVANHWPWVLWSDSMLGKMTETILLSLRTKLGAYPVVQQAYSGDMPQWIAARQGGLPPGVRVLNSRDETLKQGVLPASGDVSIVVSPEFAATDLQPFVVDIAGVAGLFQPLQVAGIADPTDPGNIPYTYTTGTFTRRTPGPAVVVPDGTPVKTGYRYRNFRTWITPSRHAFYRRYVNITIPAAATGGTFKLAYNAQVTGNISWNSDDATLMGNIQTAMRALTGASTVFVTQGFIDGSNGPDRNFCIQFDDNDTAALITVNTNALTGTSNPITTGPLGDGVEDTIDCAQAMVNNLTDQSRQHLVITDIGPNSAETLGTVRRARFDALNDGLRDVFGPWFWPGFRMLRDPTTMAFYGYTATSNDLADIAAGITPRQLRLQDDGTTTDTVHLGPSGYDILTSLFAVRADARRDYW